MLFTCSSFLMTTSVSATLGVLSVFVWDITPTSWLCEYGEIPDIKHNVKNRSIRVYVTFFQVVFFLYLLQATTFSTDVSILFIHTIVLFSLLQISISDVKFQIIQDQWIIVIAICALALPLEFQAKVQGFLLPVIFYYTLALLQKLWNIQAPFGMGDAKLIAALGLCFGSAALTFIVCVALLISGAWAALLVLEKKATKKDRIFFGPFLAIACVYFMRSTLSI